MHKISLVVGTRPEAIKMAPLFLELNKHSDVRTRLVSSGQHRDLLTNALDVFGIQSDVDLSVMTPGQSLSRLTARAIDAFGGLFESDPPDLVMVHGDTSTAMAASVAAFLTGIPVAHVEAGLRTRDPRAPFPEEMNRQVIARIASLHFPPTDFAAQNLLSEGVPETNVFVTGNTVVDALAAIHTKYHADSQWLDSAKQRLEAEMPEFDFGAKIVLVTLHRRENHGAKFQEILGATRALALRNTEVQFVFPVHPNPIISSVATKELGGIGNVFLCSPLGYIDFTLLLSKSVLAISDSGGVQEESVTLNTPVLVAREATERPEGLPGGMLTLVGSSADLILEKASLVLEAPQRSSSELNLCDNPYGDGLASERIVNISKDFLKSRR